VSERRLIAAKNMAVRQRNYRRARERALTALAQQYPDDYKSLLEREKARDEQEGRKWLDIDGTTGSMGIRPTTTANAQANTSNYSKDESNYGGEA
jgi:hypothetical protein